jgi:uncharacterized membrane protein
MPSLIGFVIVLPIALGFVALGATLEGYVLSVLWGWFVVPVFGLPALSIPFAMGLALVVGLLTTNTRGDEAKDPDKKWTPMGVMVMRPAFVLLVGWIVTKFI